MSIRHGIISKLKGTTAVSDIVGTRVSGVWRDAGGTLPAITVTIVGGGTQDYHLGGDGELAHDRLQVDCWAADTVTTAQLSKAARDALTGFRGSLNGVFVNSIIAGRPGDNYDPPREGEARGIARETFDIEVTYRDEIS